LPDEAIASPLNLLGDEGRAREVLLLSYTLNLEFWEHHALSVARGLGARVTVVGDAAMVQAEPAHVRYAGVTYLDGRAVCKGGGAFHPKLLVIADEDYATVAIGSGNVTMPGWHDNAELWTVIRGDSAGGPDTFGALALWLRALPKYVHFSGAVAPALARTAELLERVPVAEAGPKLITSLEVPIIDQLPSVTSVDELIVASPFYDRKSSGLRDLLDRFQPKSTRLLIQRGDLVADGSSLAMLLAGRAGQAETIADDRYYHGKLVEWRAHGRRFALTGSPNVSAPALQQALTGSGNCELALLSEIAESLAPPSGGTITDEELASIVFQSRDRSPPAITLLGVMLAPDRIAVTLARALTQPALLEYAVGAAWVTAGALAPGAETVELKTFLTPGSGVRVRQGALVSNICFVADPTRFIRTRVEHVGRVHTNEDDVFRDASIADAFARDLAELRQFLAHEPSISEGGGGGGGDGTRLFTSWEEYLDACEAHVGQRLLAYGLALPAIGSGEGRREEGEAGTLEEEGEDGADPDSLFEADSDGADALPALDRLAPDQRRRYQRWCERLVGLSPTLPYAGRLVVLRLILDAVRGELFPAREQWLPLVAESTMGLGAPGEGFDEELARAGSLAAVALAAMRSSLPRFSEWEELRSPYERAAQGVKPLLTRVDPEAVERYAGPLEKFFGPAVHPIAVASLVGALLQPDLIADAVRLAAEELGLSVERHGDVIELNDAIGADPRRTLLAVISLCEKAAVAVTTPGWEARRALAVWRAPDLIIVMRNEERVRGARYELRGFGPGTFKNDVQGLPKPKEVWASDGQMPEPVRALLDAMGVKL
jgi:hypothetical protein